jgi:TolB-like protein
MSDASEPRPASTGPRPDRLESWKEIATYLKRGVSTVQRWEQDEGLPVWRHVHTRLATVYAYKSELDEWWRSRGRNVEAGHAALAIQNTVVPDHGTQPGFRAARWRLWVGTFAIVLGSLATFILWDVERRPATRGTATEIRSLAVLPLKNLTGDPGHDWLADAVSDVLGITVSQISAIGVVSSTSTARYKGTTKSAREIGGELGVDALVEGALLGAGDHARVTVAVVETATERRLWAGTYERDSADLLGVSIDVAGAIVQAAKANPRNGRDRLVRAHSVAPQAYNAYLRGLYFRERRHMGGCVTAEPYLQQAAAADPSFAEPHAMLAFCYAFDRLGGLMPAAEAAVRARQEVERALALDERLADAHVSLAVINHRLDYDWTAAERSFTRALEIDPRHKEALALYGELLYASGREGEGLARLRSAVALDPFSLDRNTGLGYALYNVGRSGEAIDQLRRTLELDPNWWTARLWLAESYAAVGRQEEAVKEYLVVLRQVLVPDRMSDGTAALANVYARSGWEAFWRAELELAEEEMRRPGTVWQAPHGRPRTATYLMARRYARLGDETRALAALERAYEQRSYLLPFLNDEPLFRGMRHAPRFRELVRRVGLPPD